jgi:hypothetical protein
MRAHSPLRPVLGVLALALAMAAGGALAGCGSSTGGSTGTGGEGGSGSETTAPPPSATTSPGAPPGVTVKSCSDNRAEPPGVRVVGASCAEGRATVAAWTHTTSCSLSKGASHSACTVGRYRCIATVTDRGIAANCARPGRSISFVVKREAPTSTD